MSGPRRSRRRSADRSGTGRRRATTVTRRRPDRTAASEQPSERPSGQRAGSGSRRTDSLDGDRRRGSARPAPCAGRGDDRVRGARGAVRPPRAVDPSHQGAGGAGRLRAGDRPDGLRGGAARRDPCGGPGDPTMGWSTGRPRRHPGDGRGVRAPAGGRGLASLTLLFLGIGLLAGLIDVAMNIEAVAVERRFERRVMSAIHGTWSVALFVGAALASAGIAAGVPIEIHLPISAAVVVLVSSVFLRWLPEGREAPEEAISPRGRRMRTSPARARPRVLLLLCLVAGGSFLVEGIAVEWSAVFLRESVGAASSAAGLGVVAFSAGMAAVALHRGSARRTVRSTRRRSGRRLERVRGARRDAVGPSPAPVRRRTRDRRPRPRPGGSARVPDRRPDVPPRSRERPAARGDRRLRGLDRRTPARGLHRRPGHPADRVPRAGRRLRGVGVGRGSDPRSDERETGQATVPSIVTSDPSGAGATTFPSICRPSTSSDVIRPVMPTGLPIAIR